MRPFLLVWNAAQLDIMQDQLLAYLDTRNEIRNYFAPFPGTVLLIAEQTQTPSSLSHLIHNRYLEMTFAVLPADQWSTNGWMPKMFWDLMREPKESERYRYIADWFRTNTPSTHGDLPSLAELALGKKRDKK